MSKAINNQLRRLEFLRQQALKLEVLAAHVATTLADQRAHIAELEAEICAAIGDTQISTQYGIATVREEKVSRITDENKLPPAAFRPVVTDEVNHQWIEHMHRSGERVPGAVQEIVRKVVFR